MSGRAPAGAAAAPNFALLTPEDIEALLPKSAVEFDPTISHEFLELHVDVIVSQSDGTELTERVGALTGMPGVPLTEQQRMAKFFMCATRVLAEPEAKDLANLLEHVEELSDMRGVMDLARADGDAPSGASST